MTNADEILFRCSSLGYIMTSSKSDLTENQLKKIAEFQGKPKLTEKQEEELQRLIQKRDNPQLSETCIQHLVDVFVSAKYGRREQIKSKYIKKGNEREEDSITLLSRMDATFFKKNSERLKNEFITGEPDLFEGEHIRKAKKTLDTKTSWSAHTFFRAKNATLDPKYKWQGNGYMGLTGAEQHDVVYCLVNGTDKIINDEKRKLAYEMEVIDLAADPDYIEKCKQIEINHIFDLESFQKDYPFFEFSNNIEEWKYDIPMEERIFKFAMERDDEEIKQSYERVKECRAYMNEHFFKVEKILSSLLKKI